MADINHHSIENAIIPEHSNLIVQDQDLTNEQLVEPVVHLSGKSTESNQDTLQSNVHSENTTEENNIQQMEQLSLHPSTNSHNIEQNGLDTEERTPTISQGNENPPQSEEQNEIESSRVSSSLDNGEPCLSVTPEETTLLPTTDLNTTALEIDRIEADTAGASTTEADATTQNVSDSTNNAPILQHSTSSVTDVSNSTPSSTTSTPSNLVINESVTLNISPTSVNGTQRRTSSSNHQNSNNRGRSVSSVNPSTTSGGLLPRSQRVWEMDRQAPECRRCHRRFNFLIRRHHCRRCGQIVCDKCSSHRIRLPVEELIEDPMIPPSQYPMIASQYQRVCDTCYREPIRRSSDSQHQRRSHRSGNNNSRSMSYGSQMRRTDSSQSLMIDCPVCGQSFLGMQKDQQEEHLQQCLNVGSPPVQAARYIVYKLSEDSAQVGDECPICFEEFDHGDKVSRMICLCSYHQHCLASWLERGKGCPVHYDSLHNTQDSY